MKTILVLNGPNLNLLGRRQPEVYGHETLEDVARLCEAVCSECFALRLDQSNHEGQIIEWIHEAREVACGIVINPGAFTHTSVAILDALNAFDGPVIEVHISQVHKREAFRHHSFVSYRADGVIAGLGLEGYAAAVRRICQLVGDAGGAAR
jgi:3-dehydroquinate dehydratase II